MLREECDMEKGEDRRGKRKIRWEKEFASKKTGVTKIFWYYVLHSTKFIHIFAPK